MSAFRRSVWNRYMASSAHTVLSSVPRHIQCDQAAGAAIRICWTAEGRGGLPDVGNTLTTTERVTVLGATLGRSRGRAASGRIDVRWKYAAVTHRCGFTGADQSPR